MLVLSMTFYVAIVVQNTPFRHGRRSAVERWNGA